MGFAQDLKTGTVPDLLNEFGESAQIIVPGEPTGPAFDPQPGVPTEVDVKVAPGNIREMHRNNSLVQTTDWTGIMVANMDTVPQIDMTVRIEGEIRQLKHVEKIRAQGLTVAYEIAARV